LNNWSEAEVIQISITYHRESRRAEYIGILVDRVFLDRLSWLHPNPQEPAPIWDDARLFELWLELEQQPDRGVYYQSFEVVDSPVGCVIP
jgi:hypothetical protein